MTQRLQPRDAFTLTELMITVIIIGIIAAFGIPNYQKAINRAREKDAFVNLEVIKAALQMYMVRTGGVNPANLGDTSTINTTLSVQIIENGGNTYLCNTVGNYGCQATNAGGWTLRFEPVSSNGIVYCSSGAGTCPNCAPLIAGCPY